MLQPVASRSKAREYRYFRVKHANGTISIVQGEQWRQALLVGMIFQPDELAKADPRLAHVASGLTCQIDSNKSMTFLCRTVELEHHNVRSNWFTILRAFILVFNPQKANQYEHDLMGS